MTVGSAIHFTPETLSTPLLDKLSDLLVETTGMRLVVVYPTPSGLQQILIGSSRELSSFCKLVQGSRNGSAHCQMCHLVMTRASRSPVSSVQRCHTGVCAMVRLVSGEKDTSLAVLSSCSLCHKDIDASWEITRRRSKELHIDEQTLKKAHAELTVLTPEKRELAGKIMDMAANALKLLLDKLSAEAELAAEKKLRIPDKQVGNIIERELRKSIATLGERGKGRPANKDNTKPASTLISMISELVTKSPHLPFTLRAVAAACHITPNHFSYLFHKEHKQCFSEFLTEKRLELSMQLLKDLTLNISQVAANAGFRDAGYFARRFRQVYKVSPREWRQNLSRS